MNDTTTKTTKTTTSTTTSILSWSAAVAVGAAGLSALMFGACGTEDGSGDIVTLAVSNESATPINSIVLAADMDVRVLVDPDVTQGATVRIDDNLLDNIDASIDSDGELYVGYHDAMIDTEPSEQPQLILSVQSLDSIENRNDGTITVRGVERDDLEIDNQADGAVDVIDPS